VPDKDLNIILKIKDLASQGLLNFSNKLGGVGSKLGPLNEALKSHNERMKPFVSFLKEGAIAAAPFVAAIGAVGVVAFKVGKEILSIVNETAKLEDELAKMSAKTGIAVEDLSVLRREAELGDASITDLGTSIKIMAQRMADAISDPESDAASYFNQLGIAVTDASGKMRPTIDVFNELANRISRMPDEIMRVVVAQELLGRSGNNLLPMLIDLGKKGFDAATAEAKIFGDYISTDAARAAEEYNDTIRDMNAQLDGLKRELGNELIPTLTEMVHQVNEGIIAFKIISESPIGTWAENTADYLWDVAMAASGLATNLRIARALLPGGDTGGKISRDLASGGKAEALEAEALTGQMEADIAPGAFERVIVKPTKKGGKGGKKEEKGPWVEAGMTKEEWEGQQAYIDRAEVAYEGQQKLAQAEYEGQMERYQIMADYNDLVESEAQAHRDMIVDIYKSTGAEIGGAMGDAMAGMLRGQKNMGKQFLKATGEILGGVAKQHGQLHIAEGIGKIAEGGWPPNPIAIMAGGKEIAAGVGLVTLGALLAGGGGGDSGGGGRGGGGGGIGGYGGGGVPAAGMAAERNNQIRATIDFGRLSDEGIITNVPKFTRELMKEMNKALGSDVYLDITGGANA